jgi:DnaJ-class molecular chaperone
VASRVLYGRAMDDPYKILGVERGASEDEIRTAYRRLAKQHHPDLNPGKKEAEEKFKRISAANALLSDAEKRARFDRGEIDAMGNERPPERPFYRGFGDAGDRSKYRAEDAFGADDWESIFGQAFGDRMRRGGKSRGSDVRYALTVDFLEAANGAKRRVTLPDGRVLDVTIPPGLEDEQVLRLRGQGMAGPGGGPAGDALIEVSVAPHGLFRRDGKDLIIDLPVTLAEAVLGARVEVPTIKGSVYLTIPPNSNSGTRLRLKERGIAGGHQFVDLKIVLPPEPEPELTEFLKSWTPAHPFDPRKGML